MNWYQNLLKKFYNAIGIYYLNIELMSTSVPVILAWMAELASVYSCQCIPGYAGDSCKTGKCADNVIITWGYDITLRSLLTSN